MESTVNEAPRYVTVRDYLRVARERRWLILALTLLFGAAAYIYASQQTKVYEAEASIEFLSQSTQTSLFGQNVDVGGQTPESRAAAAASTLVRPAVLARVKRLIDFPGPAQQLASKADARPEARTNLVIVTADGRTGPIAAELANAFARAAVEVSTDDARRDFGQAADAQRRVLQELGNAPASSFARELTRQSMARLDELSRIARPAVLRREATAPGSPSSPHVLRTTLLGVLVGLTLGLIAAFFRDSMDGRFRSVGDIPSETGLRVLGHVPERILGAGLVDGGRSGLRRRRKPLADADLEQFRILRANIEFLDPDHPPKLLLVTSAMPDEGKSTVATALAAAFATAGRRTLVVEGDLRRPTLADRLGVQGRPGLSDYLTGSAEPQEILQTVALPAPPEGSRPADAPAPEPVVAIVAGPPAPQPAELLRSERCRAFFEDVKQTYDVVIVDGCPLLPVVDALELVPVADAVILCLRGSKTARAQVEAATELLSHLPERATGVVVTGTRVGDEDQAFDYYAYAARRAGAPA